MNHNQQKLHNQLIKKRMLKELKEHFTIPDKDENDTWDNLIYTFKEDNDTKYWWNKPDMIDYIAENPFTYHHLNASGMGDYLKDEYSEYQTDKLNGEDIDDDTYNYIENLLWKVGYL